MAITIDIFDFTETNKRPWAEQVARGARITSREVEDDTSWEQIAAALATCPKGSTRGCAFEVQTASGIWDTADGRGFRVSKTGPRFRTWEEIEAEEEADEAAEADFEAMTWAAEAA